MKDFWNERYRADEFAYGKAPNKAFHDFLTSDAHLGQSHSTKEALQNPTVLCLAEGEGRNAVFAASQGYRVLALDYSEEGRRKTLSLAQEMGVVDRIEYHVMDLTSTESLDWIRSLRSKMPEEKRVVVGAVFCFTHLPSEICNSLYEACASILEPDGWIFLEGFGKEQLHYQSGGPKNEALLFEGVSLKETFRPLFKDVKISSEIKQLDEGPYHQGESHLITVHAQGVK